MTRYEAEATNGFTGARRKGADWSQILVPIVAAALVIALGLAFVGITSEPDTQLNPPPAAAGTF
jgi:flagellar basal body-associated protein FliL